MFLRFFVIIAIYCLTPVSVEAKNSQGLQPKAKNNQRAYNLIMTERHFGIFLHNYALLGLEKASNSWNFLGGKKDPQDKNRGVTAARELYEESGMVLDKRHNTKYWYGRPFYEFGSHIVFIHEPGNLFISCSELNAAAIKAISNKKLPHDYKEMTRYQLIKIADLVSLAQAQTKDGAHDYYSHPQEHQIMKIDGWLLYTLKYAGTEILQPYMY
jgi:8-oxo-dGTP pyrophosphatase MutT (NUDIX family)